MVCKDSFRSTTHMKIDSTFQGKLAKVIFIRQQRSFQNSNVVTQKRNLQLRLSFDCLENNTVSYYNDY